MQKFKIHSAAQRRNKRKFGYAFTKFIQNLFALFVLICIGLFLLPADAPETFEQVLSKFDRYFDFRVENIEVIGNDKISKEEIIKLSGIKYADSLVNVDLEKVKQQIHKNNWIASLVVSRKFPNRIRILIEEEKPAALFVEKDKIFLINLNGKKIEEVKRENLDSGYIIVKGENANQTFSELLAQIYNYHIINKAVVELHRRSNRRWDIILENKTKIMLPEHNFPEAIKFANDFLEESKIKFATVIDLRLLPDKIFLREVK